MLTNILGEGDDNAGRAEVGRQYYGITGHVGPIAARQ